MSTRIPPSLPPTEKLLGPWSMTALAALLVVGGILVMIPGKSGIDAADDSASSLHPEVSVPTISVRSQTSAVPVHQATPASVDGSAAVVAGRGANSESLTSAEHPSAGSRLTTPNQ